MYTQNDVIDGDIIKKVLCLANNEIEIIIKQLDK